MMFFFLVLAFFDLSSLRTHFWPLPVPSENFSRHGRKPYGSPRGTRFGRIHTVQDSSITLALHWTGRETRFQRLCGVLRKI